MEHPKSWSGAHRNPHAPELALLTPQTQGGTEGLSSSRTSMGYTQDPQEFKYR